MSQDDGPVDLDQLTFTSAAGGTVAVLKCEAKQLNRHDAFDQTDRCYNREVAVGIEQSPFSLFSTHRDRPSPMPTLGEFLRDGLWQLDIDQPASAQEARRSRQHVTRPASGQSMRVLELTPERRITVKFDPAGTNKFGVQLNEHLRLDATAPSDLMSSHANAMAGSMSFQPLTADNCASALSYVYGVVNNIVADSNLRKDPGNAHLWSMWNVEGTTTYLANGIQGSSSTTSGKADAACISNYGSQYAAIGTVVVRLASQLSFEDRTARMGGFGRCVVSKEGLQVYLSAATNQVRAWNCPLENRQAKFWADLVTEVSDE